MRTPRRRFPADAYLALAIQHLRSQFGCKSQAESFLVCLVGRSAPLINELEQELSSGVLEPDIRNSILAEVRSFEPGPVENNPRVIRVNTLDAPKYPHLEVRWLSHNCSPGRYGRQQFSSTESSITSDEEDHNSFPPSDRISSPVISRQPLRRLQSPKPVHPPPRSPLDWLNNNSSRNVCTPPGDPDDPDPFSPSQQQDFGDPRLPNIEHGGLFNRGFAAKELSYWVQPRHAKSYPPAYTRPVPLSPPAS